MSEQPKTRQEVAATISQDLDSLTYLLDGLSLEQQKEIVGPNAVEELEKGWADNILTGMKRGSITVGDPRLADALYRIERSLVAIPDEVVQEKFTQHHTERDIEGIGASLEEFLRTRAGLSGATNRAMIAGLTTPGQDLYAGQRRSPLRSV